MDFSAVDQWIESHQTTLKEWLADMVRCPLPCSDPASGDNCQDVVEAILRGMGMGVSRQKPVVDAATFAEWNYDTRASVVGRIDGAESARSLILNSHVDVVGTGDAGLWHYDPRKATFVGDTVYGRGVADARGPLASFMFALSAVLTCHGRPKGRIEVHSVADEEIGGFGARTLADAGLVADAVLVGEPSEMRFCPATRGSQLMRLRVHGLAAHSGVAYTGHSAILKAMGYITALNSLQYELDKRHAHPLWTSSPVAHGFNVASISGGESFSRVPSTCEFTCLCGCIAGETLADLRSWVEAKISSVTDSDPWLIEHPPALEWLPMKFEPCASDMSSPFFWMTRDSSIEVLGYYPEPQAFTAASDLRAYLRHPNSVGANVGPGRLLAAHTIDESIRFSELVNAAKLVARVIYRWSY